MEEVTWFEIAFIWLIIGVGALFVYLLNRSSKKQD